MFCMDAYLLGASMSAPALHMDAYNRMRTSQQVRILLGASMSAPALHIRMGIHGLDAHMALSLYIGTTSRACACMRMCSVRPGPPAPGVRWMAP